ncbi:MAG TPA: 3-phosphoshikimate 1-carboxyvinyltransferase [Flavobacteriaceae bacterium]|nr:3-phosphoshikimate 1-carboxyvinyltransferase [Flavobacteriaceae bacterium]
MLAQTISLDYRNQNPSGEIIITGSKSESNRWLILQKLWGNIVIDNLSNAEDTLLLQKALLSEDEIIDINHAGTAMRFLTSYFASTEERKVILTGSDRMKNRPIAVLVDALLSLNAEISYLEKNGFPPLKITGKKLHKNCVTLAGNMSSQYISSLLLIAPALPNGLTINFNTEITSRPYLDMTIAQLKEIGANIFWDNNSLIVEPLKNLSKKEFKVVVESDWSAASYFYSTIALSKNGTVTLNYFQQKSKQGDAVLSEIYKLFGVSTTFKNNQIYLKKDKNFECPNSIELDLVNTPDIAQTIVVTCLGLEIDCVLTGLHTLKIKETDRLQALKNELEKLGAIVVITENSLQMITPKQLNKEVTIETYHDHRMAMSFAPLSLKTPLYIEDVNVVEKSYPEFWNDFKQLFI